VKTRPHASPGGGVLVIRGSYGKVLLALAICAGFAAGGVWMIREGELSGWFVSAFFGLGGLGLLAVVLLRGAPGLILDARGFEITGTLRRATFAWSDVDEFFVMSISGAKMVGIAFSSAYTELPRARRFAQLLSGVQGAIADQYQLSPEELCALLNEWRERHTPPA